MNYKIEDREDARQFLHNMEASTALSMLIDSLSDDDLVQAARRVAAEYSEAEDEDMEVEGNVPRP